MLLARSTGATGAVIAALALGACTSSIDQKTSAPPGETVFGHVHGIGLNPGDDRVYVASHQGVFRLDDGAPTLIADRAQDTMGFTIAGPDRFLASGHPAPGSTDPNPLGLIASTDRAASWSPLSLAGTSDLHSIDTAGDTIHAYGADGQILSSQDGGRSWETIARGQFIDIAANPSAPDQLLATTETANLVSVTAGKEPTQIAGAPPLVLIDRTSSDEIVGVDPVGAVFISADDGDSWRETTSLDSRPEAFSVRSGTWFAATEDGLFRSSDKGKAWQRILVEEAS